MAEKWQERQQKLDYFHELLTCGHNVYSWIYDHRLAPVYNNCPFSMVYDIFFAMEEKRIPTINQVHKESHPIVMFSANAADVISDTYPMMPSSEPRSSLYVMLSPVSAVLTLFFSL